MRAYSVAGPNASGSAAKSMVGITATALVRPRLFDLILGSQATPADQAAEYAVSRFTAAGTSTAATPTATDPSDVAAISIGGITHSVEPTYTAGFDLLPINLNQRATFRWVASPGYELVAPATAANGLGVRLVTATASLVEWATCFFFE